MSLQVIWFLVDHTLLATRQRNKKHVTKVGHSSLRHSLDLFLDLGKEFISRILQMVSYLSVIFLDSFISKENVVDLHRNHVLIYNLKK
jgi:hypothetical protein